jgi:large subunit ribosomal protein L9
VPDAKDIGAKMEIILRETIDNLGRAGQVVKVADGYARNYLLPRKLAYPATPGNLKVIESERNSLLRKDAKQQGDAEKLKVLLEPVEIVIRRKTGDHAALYGSVTNADVSEELDKKGFQIEKRKILMEDHIKSLGEYAIPIRLFKDVIATVKLKVEAETEGQ